MIVVLVVVAVILNNLILYFWKPWLGAYGAEKAKNLARKEYLNEILSEVRAVTATQKQIEAQLSGTEWNRQILWNKRFDVYSSAMSVLSDLEASTIQLSNSELLKGPGDSQAGFADRRWALTIDLRKLVGPMMLFATSAANEALSTYFEMSVKATTLEEELAALAVVHSAVAEQAKAHLHLGESEDALPT